MRKVLTLCLLTSVIANACNTPAPLPAPDDNPLMLGQLFVAIEKEDVDRGALAQRVSALQATTGSIRSIRTPLQQEMTNDFYLAIHTAALEKTWFLSAFLEQFFPGGVNLAAQSLGTRVVKFEIQNGKLFVVDADNRKQYSDLFDPEVLVESYPIINAYDPFTRMRGNHDYILVDPSAGLNRFGVVGDAFGGMGLIRFSLELSFLQNFRTLDDGISYEHVFTGYSDQPIFGDAVSANPFKASGTLIVSLREYKTGQRYQEVPLPAQEHYFRSEARIVPNTGAITQVAAHWDLYPGMEPIEWLISDLLAQVDEDPEFAEYDLVEAVRRGVLLWNDALGFEAFRARLAEPGELTLTDDQSFILFDPDPSAGFAFANWRTNPNTGEIRGASVYFGSGWLDQRNYFYDDAEVNQPRLPRPKPKVATLTWDSMSQSPLCVLWAQDFQAHQHHEHEFDNTHMTKKEKFERYISEMIAHEIGHTLGLRHNFKGSLVEPSSSVMDYLQSSDSVAFEGLGSYDVEAVQYLYGVSPSLPRDPFCTDEDTLIDPACARFDTGAAPLYSTHFPDYQLVSYYILNGYLGDSWQMYFDYYSAGVLGFVRAADTATALDAWYQAISEVGVPMNLVSGSVTEMADGMLRRLFELLLLEDEENRYYDYPYQDLTDAAVIAAVTTQLRAVLLNLDEVRSYASRRVCVDALKKQQSDNAYAILVEAQNTLQVLLPELGDYDRLMTEDLLARINKATSPYFD